MDARDVANKATIDYPGLLASVPGLDWERASRDLLGGDLENYASFVLLFESTHGQDAEKMMAAFAGGDAQAATHLCHTLKGAAGTLGFSDLYAVAKHLEQDMRAGVVQTDLQPRIEALSGVLQDIRQAIEHVRPLLAA